MNHPMSSPIDQGLDTLTEPHQTPPGQVAQLAFLGQSRALATPQKNARDASSWKADWAPGSYQRRFSGEASGFLAARQTSGPIFPGCWSKPNSQRVTFHHCKHLQNLQFQNLRWTQVKDPWAFARTESEWVSRATMACRLIKTRGFSPSW